ncbi:DUF4231 domain-containing protein [Blastococcus haudaquaticus]|uniref:DUF4231 domain-containing protein n=1 Tax=Blastococcus haudaquaticus TaxID=1938745 RepID=UPI000BE26BF9|nr:DUF4231 domain-containing protein [Blastococcus haudaquaticus]
MISAYHDGSRSLTSVLEELAIPVGRPVLVVVGWAGAPLSEEVQDALKLLLETVVAPVCRDEGVVVVSGGTDSGVMAALGEAMAEHAPGAELVGVAPHGKLIGYGAAPGDLDSTLPERHHKLLRTTGDAWGSEGPTLVRVAERIAGRSGVVMLAVGGGCGTHREIKLAARRRWPVVLMTGSGGESERLAVALQLLATPMPPPEPGRKSLADDDDVQAAAVDGGFAANDLRERAQVERALRWRLSDNALLREAWARFAALDAAATARKPPTTRLAASVLVLASITLICALLVGLSKPSPGGGLPFISPLAGDVLKGVVTALPLIAAVLLGLIERRARSGTWVELRAAGESILREIYRFRCGVGGYQGSEATPALLGEALSAVDLKTGGRSTTSSGGGPPSVVWPPRSLCARIPPADSLLGPLSPPSYDEARVVDQLSFLEHAVRQTEREATRLALALFTVGGGAAFLLAISWRWEDVTAGAAALTGVAAALLSWREYSQREARAEAMRMTCVAVRSARARWLALPSEARSATAQLANYVAEVEEALATEGSAWERSLHQAQQGFLDRYKR